MADLEYLLLEAAGRTDAAKKNRQARAIPKKKSSGDRNESRDEDSERKASQIPLKKRYEPSKRVKRYEPSKRVKRYEPSKREDVEGSDEEGDDGVDNSDESDVGSDLYKDEDDRKRLAEMTELEREMILSDRAAKRDDKSFKERLKQKLGSERSERSGKEKSPMAPTVGVRSSARKADRAAVMGDVLNQLREKRLKHQVSKGGGALGGTKEKSPSTDSQSGSSEGESRYRSEDEASSGDGEMIDSDDERSIPGSEPPSFDDVKGITIQRSRLAKWFMEPFFDDLIVGCFVRIGIGISKSGPMYRLCEVQSVDSSHPELQYKLEGKKTHKCLICFWGNESSATKWQMAVVSDSAPTEEEFNQWLREVKHSGGKMLRRRDLLEKMESIEKAHTFVYSATTVKQMLQEKKHASSRPLNIAVEKDRLRKKLEVAESKSDEAEVERIKTRLQELEASRQGLENDARAIRLAEMNKRNRAENFKNASELRSVNKSLKAGEAGYDPFSRRWTRSRNYYIAKAGQDEAADGTAFKDMETALQAAAGAGKLVDTSAPTDQGTKSYMLHNFKLELSLDGLEKFGPQGFLLGYMARKQRIEATIGCRISENDGKRHLQTLTVRDYKRRRGLL